MPALEPDRDRRAESAHGLYQTAARLLRSGKPAPALELFNAALNLAPSDLACLQGRGLALYALEDIAGALDVFRRAMAGFPAHWTVWESLADITPEETERVSALCQAAAALERRCGEGAAPPALFLRCANALIDAHLFRDAARFTARYRTQFSTAAEADNTLSRALYNAGHFRSAFRLKARALAQLNPEDIPEHPPYSGFTPGAAAPALRELIDILAAHGIPAFLAAGTLLGVCRTGSPLPHDRDIDIGILQTPDGAPDIAALLRTHPRLRMPRAARPCDRYFGLTFRGIAADIFLYQPRGDALLCGLGNVPGDIQWRFSRFAIADQIFGGETWPVPENPGRYLAETYGPHWQTPDTGFASAISSRALYETDPYVRAYYAAGRALKALLTGDREKAHALRRQSPASFDLPTFANPGNTSSAYGRNPMA